VTALAAKAATSTVPIVFIIGDDPVQYGLVASLNRPGANVTCVNLLIAELEAKRLELLTELVPGATTFSLFVNPANPNSAGLVGNAQAAARTLGKTLHIVEASSANEIDSAFASAARTHAGGLIVGTDIFFTNRREQLIKLAAAHSLPTIHQWRESVTDGGLVSYGISHAEPYRQAASYAAVANTIGMVDVACFAASGGGVLCA
jgi:putative ABC transport system substrate-binding protein